MMPVRGDKVQKRVNERGRNFNIDSRISNLGLPRREHHGQQDLYLDVEDWEEIEALLEREQHLLGQHHHRSDPTSVNLLHSPEHILRPPLETLPRRGHTPRTIPRTHGNFSVPLNQLSSILLNMTFSDAEEDHQGSRAREASNRTGATGNDRERSTSRSRTESGVSNASTASLVTPTSSGPAANGQAHAESPSRASTAEASGASNMEMTNAVQSITVADMKGVDSKKIMEKLQQIQGYIQQTTTAMAALEQQGDTGSQSDIYNRFVTLNKSLQHQEGEYLDILARLLVLNKAAAQVANGCPNNESVTTPPVNGREETESVNTSSSVSNHVVGLVGPGNVATLQERLAASQEESTSIMGRMRDSIARREDLMVRYKATRERLENLKKQQQDIRTQERQLLHAAGTSETPYEDPIPGAENWTIDEVAQGIVEFQALYDKVDRLQGMYSIKAQNADPDDEVAQADVTNKLNQLATKRRMLIETITKLRRIERQRQEEQLTDTGEGPARSQRNSTAPAETPDSNQGSVSDRPIGEVSTTTSETAPRSSAFSTDDVSQLNINATANNVAAVSDEISSRQLQLQTLQEQLGDMRKLLDVTTAGRKEDERRMLESQKRLAEAEAAKARFVAMEAQSERTPAMDGAVGGEMVEVAGRRLRLTEIDKQNPEILKKYQEISKAKERLSKMEEVMEMIATAKRNHQNLREVIPPDYLAILEEAEAERDDDLGLSSNQSSGVTTAKEEPEEELRLSRRHPRTSRRGSLSRSDVAASVGRNERDHRVREKENSDISAMQKRLNKTSTRVSAINEGSRHGHEKGAVKKQPQALWQEGTTTVDPRVSEVLAMQEELRQKKNTLEALMKRMGKSSSLNMDNISDNISDNVSETSDRLDGGNGTTATWGTAGLHDYSDNHYQHSSDEELIEEENEGDEVPVRAHRRSQQPTGQPKDRNRHSATRHRRRQDSGRFSVNNLTTAHSGRPKHNRLRGSSVPKASWEAVDGSSYKSPSNTTLQAHQTLGAALSQLSQVQGTINNLQESLRQEQNQVLGSGPFSQFMPQYLPDVPSAGLTPTSLPPHIPGMGTSTNGVQALTPMSPYAGLGSLALGSQGGNESSGQQMNQQLMLGLQQCFSQLHLHSLEIQALSKHLQLLDRRDQADSLPVPDSGGGRLDRRRGRTGTRRSEDEEEEEEDDDDDDVTAATRPSYPLHHNLLAASHTRDGKESASRVPQSLSFPLFLSQPGDGEAHPTGVTNPIYGRLGDVREPGSWGSFAPTPGTEQPSEQLASMMGVGGVVDNSPSHPLLHLDRMSEERPQSQPPDDHHWASLASTHPLHHQTTDLLNNQVPPGTRANNYWDNFRSYSRQNLLSTATKSNTSDHHPASTASISAATPSGTAGFLQSREPIRVEDKRFNVSVSHNNNSSSGGGARARVSNPHLNNPRGGNARVRNPVSTNSQQILGQNKHKTNNRNKQGGWWLPGSGSKVPSTNIPPSVTSAGTSRDRSYVNYNSVRGSGNDSDSTGAVTLEVLKEAEALMRRHASQPEFLLQLFRHASQITVHTDQHVAVALLQDLATQPHGSNHGVNANSRGNNNETNSLSLPAPLRDSSWRQQTSPSHPHNILPQENVSVVGLSGSEVSDSGLTSEDEDSRALYRNVKNLSLSPSGRAGLSGAIPRSTPGVNTSSHSRPQFPQPQQYQSQFPHHNYQYFPQQPNLSNNQGGSSRSVANSESSLYDHLVFNDSHMGTAHPQQVVEEWICRSEGEAGEEKLQNQPETVGSSPEDAHHIIHPLNNDTEYLTFETLVSSAVRASVEILLSQLGGSQASGGLVSPLLITSLHNTLVAQIQTQAQSLQLPQSFLFSVDTELKSALQAFSGKPLLEVSNDVPSVVSQVLLTQYCSVLVQRLRDNHPVLPQTPTKLPQSKIPISEAGAGNVATVSSTSQGRHTQENTTATQTESSVFSLTPHQHASLSHSTDLSQRPNHHGSRTFSLTSSTGSSVTHGSAHSSHLSSHAVAHPSIPSSSPHPPPHITASVFQSSSSGGGHWQVPLSAPLPSPNENGASVETLIDNSINSINSHPTSQPESWAVSSGIGQVAESPAPASRPNSRLTNNIGAAAEWAEPEHEEAMMDDNVEPSLPVHDLAEADQSQDAAEGDWEDSQAEGIQADSGGAVGNASPQHSSWLQAREKSSQQMDAEGMVECDADAAEGTTRGAVGHHGYGEHHKQGASRELELDEVPTKLQSPEGGSPRGTPEHQSSAPQGHHQSTPSSHSVQPPHSPGGSEG
ncbi:uncharacterized protein LOC121880024 isoform X4 [Homarus americanus]|uniref:uncharacterized protein LOC121880024 isoform X4 n=1 Tax=Homarus americanus TaxID=6706 RepID=UPI001C4911F1|nr:uncharacterized protein LOC121880024 isoform X4 [Homarus americanus]